MAAIFWPVHQVENGGTREFYVGIFESDTLEKLGATRKSNIPVNRDFDYLGGTRIDDTAYILTHEGLKEYLEDKKADADEIIARLSGVMDDAKLKELCKVSSSCEVALKEIGG